MKRLLIVALVLVLLSGCSGKKTETAQEAGPVLENVQGWYRKDSHIEQQTGGAVRQYTLPDEEILDLSAVSDKLMLTTKEEGTKITLLTGADCVPVATLTLDTNAVGVKAIFNAVSYYQKDTNEAVCLDQQLQQISRIKLPDEIQGTPVYAPDGSEIFYCWNQEIRAYDTTLNIVRPVKSHSCKSQKLTGAFFGGEVLSCEMEQEDGTKRTEFISSQTGETLADGQFLKALATYEQSYLAVAMDGVVQQNIFGATDQAPQNMNIPQTQQVISVLPVGGILGYRVEENNDLALSFYETATGTKMAAVTLKGVGTPKTVIADPWSNGIWILTDEALYRWEHKKTPVQEDGAYITAVFTKDAPDTAGLDDAQDRADALGDAHDIDIRIYTDAVKTPGDYVLEAEHQPVAINSVLDDLEPVLELFPEKFLYRSVNRQVRLCIVRSVSGEQKGVQYWQGSEGYIAITPGGDVREQFMQAFAYIVNSHVLGSSTLLDNWEQYNPQGFSYGDNQEKYLKGQDRFFVDSHSMTSITEDRARMFWQATKENNGEMFHSDGMQKKLRQLCLGIRDAWRLEGKSESYLWEQYLAEPITAGA